MEKTLPFIDLGQRLSLRQLRLIVEIAQAGSLVGAAKKLHLTQSAATKSLQDAESAIGLPLFARTAKGAVSTEVGVTVIEHARIVLRQLAFGSQELHDIVTGFRGRLAIGAVPSGSAELLPKAIDLLKAARPALSVHVVEGNNDRLVERLKASELDLIVGRLPVLNDPAFTQEVLFNDICCVVVSPTHPLTAAATIDLADLMHLEWSLPIQESAQSSQIEQAFRARGLRLPERTVDSVSYLVHRALVATGRFVAVWPWEIARWDVFAGNLAVLPIVLRETIHPVGMTMAATSRHPPALVAMCDAMRAAASGLATCPFLPPGDSQARN